MLKFSDRFAQHYQPIVDLRSLSVFQYEALLRPLGADAQAVILELEKSGEIRDLDCWSISKALDASKSAGHLIAVNVSALTACCKETTDRIDTILSAAGDASRITLEITETVQIASYGAARYFSAMAKNHGCRVGLDDFGDGHARLSTVTELDLDFIKLSSRLTSLIGISSTAEQVIQETVMLAEGYGIPIVAEHVETLEQLRWLQDESIQYGQGWLFSRATPEITSGLSFATRVGQDKRASIDLLIA